MEPLAKTNLYIRDPEERRRRIEDAAYESSVFEGATGLRRPKHQPFKARSIASRKKRARGDVSPR